MEQFADFEFFNAIASSIGAAHEILDAEFEQIDDFPEQEDNSGLFGEDRLEDEEPLTVEEKEDILQGIQRLPPQYLKGMWNIMTGLIGANDGEEEEQQSPTLMLRQLDHYLKRKTNIVFQEEQPGQEI